MCTIVPHPSGEEEPLNGYDNLWFRISLRVCGTEDSRRAPARCVTLREGACHGCIILCHHCFRRFGRLYGVHGLRVSIKVCSFCFLRRAAWLRSYHFYRTGGVFLPGLSVCWLLSFHQVPGGRRDLKCATTLICMPSICTRSSFLI